MNSSGIKRGLAVSAVSALAIAGVPLLASSASAAPGETLTVVSVGPTLNGGDLGGQVHLKLSATVDEDDIDGTNSDLEVSNPNLNGPASNGNQAVEIVDVTFIANGAPGDSNTTDGLDEAIVDVKVTTSDTGATATYAIYVDDDGGHTAGPPEVPDVDAGEARVQVSQATSGPLAKVEIAPATQNTSQTITSGAYTVTAKDAQGRTTQLNTGDTIAISSSKASVPVSDGSFTDLEMQDGSHTFTATPDNTNASLGTTTFTADPAVAATPAAPNATATLVVGAAANLTDSMVDIVTAADSWNGFGNPVDSDGDNTLTLVRVDQGSIKIDIKGGLGNAGATVTLNLNGNAGPNQITFGGKATSTVSTVLDAQGNGSLTITPDAGTVQENEEISITGSFTEDLVFQRAAADAVVSGSDLYFSALKATTTVTAKIVDQFGNPVTTGFVSAFRDAVAPNAETPPGQIKPVGADGTVSFDFTDTNAAVGDTDTVTFAWVPDQFTPINQAITDTATIRYTATGQGADYNTFLDTVNTGSGTYKPTDVSVIPLTDGEDDSAGEGVDIAITGAEPNQAITLSVDNGALIVNTNTGGDTIPEGVSSIELTTDNTGALPTGYRIIGTKSGVTTLTVNSANRTETAQFTVAAQTDPWTARNLSVSGPAEVESGTTQISYKVVVTDAHGNPVANFPVNQLNVQVTGPAQFQDSDALTNAAGELNLNVRVDSDAEGEVAIKVTGLSSQFGAAANQEFVGAAANSAPGLTVSVNQATASTMVEAAAPEPVDPKLAVSGKGGKTDKVTANAIGKAAGAKATLWVGGVKKKTGTLNASGNFTFSIKDKNGKKATKYVVKISATDLTTADQASAKIK